MEREHIKLHEESLLKHEEHDVKMNSIKKELTDVNRLARAMENKVRNIFIK